VSQWTHENFDSMSWHDNHVHGLRPMAGEHGLGELELDLDYILEWLAVAGDAFRFRIAPARLRFRDVSDLRLAIDYVAASAAIGPFSIAGIERRTERRERSQAVCWRIVANFPPGEISFQASGFTQQLTGREVLVDRQWLRRLSPYID